MLHPQDLSTCEQSGRDLAVQVKRRLKTKEQGSMGSMAAVTASGPQLAMGRVVGSLCVITARDEDYSTGMIASWVSQVRDKGVQHTGLDVGNLICDQVIGGSKWCDQQQICGDVGASAQLLC